MPAFIEDSLDHHVWATLRLLDVCLPLSEDQLAAPVPGTYGSILDTLRHLVSGDTEYLALLSGGLVPVHDEVGDVAELRAAMEADAAAWRELLARKPDPDAIVARHREDGSESRVSVGLRLAQVIEHSADHRSQVCTGLTAIGIEPPDLSVWAYATAMDRVEVVAPAT